MRRPLVWLHLVIGWIPIWALFTVLIVGAHSDVTLSNAILASTRMMLGIAILSIPVRRLTKRFPWPHPFRASFALVHLVAAPHFALAWLLFNSLIESMHARALVIAAGYGFMPFIVLGIWLYVMIAGVMYATDATERAARAEALAARSQLAALRAQLNPHFLFNALHSVVQLIPLDPPRAAEAAEQIGGLLRTTIEEDRDLVTVAEERAFVEKYLDVERIRFGDRLRVHVDVPEEIDDALVPSFSLLTLVENAVRHGAEPRVDTTDLAVTGRADGNMLTLSVRDTGRGITADELERTSGTGIKRLRDRLTALYGGGATLDLSNGAAGGLTASLTVPLRRAD
ncbi:MAG TPA: histidine kinase [Gemmatimonadaceae bacterium]|nr:histidine kinase [Gemmatimonadaceae bacterium]